MRWIRSRAAGETESGMVYDISSMRVIVSRTLPACSNGGLPTNPKEEENEQKRREEKREREREKRHLKKNTREYGVNMRSRD